MHEHLKGHGIRIIRNIIHENGTFVLDFAGILTDDLPLYRDLHLSHDVLHGHHLILKVTSVNNIRIIRFLNGSAEIAALLSLSKAALLEWTLLSGSLADRSFSLLCRLLRCTSNGSCICR